MDKINVVDLQKLFETKKPDVKPKTIAQYVHNLKKLKESYNDTEGFEFLNNSGDVMDKLTTKKYTTQRNILNAIIVFLIVLEKPDEFVKQYRDKRDDFNKQYQDEQASGIISEKQKDNFITLDELTSMVKKMELDIKQQKLKTLQEMSQQQHDLLTGYTIFTMLINYPTRNDMAGMTLVSRTVFNRMKSDRSCNYLIMERGKLSMV